MIRDGDRALQGSSVEGLYGGLHPGEQDVADTVEVRSQNGKKWQSSVGSDAVKELNAILPGVSVGNPT